MSRSNSEQSSSDNLGAAILLGVCVAAGLIIMGYLLSAAALDIKAFERSVTVKGLSERDYPADTVIWPIQFTAADNDLGKLYQSLDNSTAKIRGFLASKGISIDAISVSAPAITDKSAQQWGTTPHAEFRYTAVQTVTVYSQKVELVRSVMTSLSELGREGIVFSGGNYETRPDYVFSKLNDVKPEMIEEATKKAREVAVKFAQDSESTLGKIKQASQGQFSIAPRDNNNPHIKKVRVVSTVEYYLSD